jgi:hypothetical protein
MSDEEKAVQRAARASTAEEVAELMKLDCPSRRQLEPKKALHRCQFAGFSQGCSDCTYSWSILANTAIDVARKGLSRRYGIPPAKLHSFMEMNSNVLEQVRERTALKRTRITETVSNLQNEIITAFRSIESVLDNSVDAIENAAEAIRDGDPDMVNAQITMFQRNNASIYNDNETPPGTEKEPYHCDICGGSWNGPMGQCECEPIPPSVYLGP